MIEAEELEDLVLCGHSYGGQVITPVLDRQIDKFCAAIWLDAFVPQDGHSLMVGWSPERAQRIREQVATTGDGWKVDPMPPDYFGVMDPDDADWVTRRCVPQPIRTFFAAGALDWRMAIRAEKMYLLAEHHPNSNFNRFATPLSHEPDWDVRTISSGHDVMIDAPELLAELLPRIWLGQFRVIRCTEPRLRTGCIVERRFHRPVEILLYQPPPGLFRHVVAEIFEPFPPDGHMADLVLVDYLQSGDGIWVAHLIEAADHPRCDVKAAGFQHQRYDREAGE